MYLVDSLEHVLNRILNGNDVQSARAEHIKSGVERRRLARSSGPGNQQRPLRLSEHFGQRIGMFLPKTQLEKPYLCGTRMQQTDHDFFAVGCRQSGYAKVAFFLPHPD